MGICGSDICADGKGKREKKEHKENKPSKPSKPMEKTVSYIEEKEPIKKEGKYKYTDIKENGHILDKTLDTNSSFEINLKFFFEENNLKKVNFNKISSISKLSLLKYISTISRKEQFNSIKNEKLKNIILKLKKDLELINNEPLIKNRKDLPKDIKTILEEKGGNNIFEYAKYINSVIEIKDIKELIQIFAETEKNKINSFLNNILQLEKANLFFEEEFVKAQKESIFDYSITNLTFLGNKKLEKYEKSKKNCPNCIKKLLFHGSQIGPISEIITSEFKYTRKAFYGMGIYFSDSLDYSSFYCGGDNYKKRRFFFNKILPPGAYFNLIAAEVFYDKKLFKHIRSTDLFVRELDHFPTYEEIKRNYPDKMVKKNGIHFITVQTDHGQVIEDTQLSINLRERGEFIGNEYVITELDQILPIYSITLKRNEYFVLWRDPNFEGNNYYYEYLKNRKLFANEMAKMNIYIEKSTEAALKFIHKRRYNKMILITSIGLDLSGKKFAEIARKILSSKIIILFFSSNKDHLEWIQKFPNALYTDTGLFYQEYIKKYNKNDLKLLKKKIEENYNIKLLDFTNEFLSYPLYLENKEYSDVDFSEKNQYIRTIYIIYKPNNMYLIMNKDGTFKMTNKKDKAFIWDITIDDEKNELTLFSNGYYLGINEITNEIKTNEYMKIWIYNKINDCYLIKSKDNNYILSLNYKNNLCLSLTNDNSVFEFIDV